MVLKVLGVGIKLFHLFDLGIADSLPQYLLSMNDFSLFYCTNIAK